MDNLDTPGKRLAAARKQCGLKQAPLYKAMGYTYNVISKFEKGDARPTRAEWERLVELLGPDLTKTISPADLAKWLMPDKEEWGNERAKRVEAGIVQRLTHLRQVKGYTARYVAGKIGVKPSGYTRIEQGASNPTYSQLRSLVQLYGTSYEYLLDGVLNRDQALEKERKENARLRKAMQELLGAGVGA